MAAVFGMVRKRSLVQCRCALSSLNLASASKQSVLRRHRALILPKQITYPRPSVSVFLRYKAAAFSSVSSPSPPSPSAGASSYERFLTEEERVLLKDEREVLNRILLALEASGPHPPSSLQGQDLKLLRAELERLDDLFLLVVVGEFNSGKSSLINALLGRKFLPEGTHSRTVSVPWMRYVKIVDTPGTNAIDRHHEKLTRDFVPLSDLLLFVTSADRPFSESERAFLESIREWGKKALVIINKIDLLSDEQLREVRSYVRDRARSVLGSDPQVFHLSAKAALKAKLEANAEPSLALSLSTPDWTASNMLELERSISLTLDSEERLRLKLDSPAATAGRICKRQQEILQYQLEVLKGDMRMLEQLEARLKLFRSDMLSDFSGVTSRLEVNLQGALRRAESFIDDKLNYSNFYEIIREREKLVKEFEEEVGDIEQEVSRQVDELAGWMVRKCQRHFDDAMGLFQQRLETRRGQLAQREVSFASENSQEYGKDGRLSGFDVSRSDVLRQMFEAVKLAQEHDLKREGELMTQGIKSALLMGGAIEVGAVGVFGALFSASLLDVTTITSTSLFVLLGLGVFPYRRVLAKQQLRSRVEKLERELKRVMHARFEEQLQDHSETVKDAVLPFSRFVRATSTTVDLQLAALREAEKDIEELRHEISKIGNRKSS